MSELKTRATKQSAAAFIDGIEDESRRQDCERIAGIMREVTGEEPRMWGSSMVGFGSYHYRYASGREGDWFLTGFAPRKRDLTVYIMSGFESRKDLMKRLGKYKTGKSCLYIKRLDDIDTDALRELIADSIAELSKTWGQA